MQREATPTKNDQGQRGATLPLIAISMVALLGLAALAVDLGWLYVHTSKTQRTADASALAAVIHMPQRFDRATVAAREIAASNGYQHGVDSTVAVSEVSDDPAQVEVTVTRTVDLFFMRVFGMTDASVSRTARAEYLPPIPLGSPANIFGNACNPADAGCTGQANFWANIHGKYTNASMGDAYSSFCANNTNNATCAQNPSWRSRGYLYGVERGSNGGFTIEFLDMAHHNISGGQTTSDFHRTGDRGCEAWGDATAACGQTVTANLYAPDPTPLDVTDNTLICSHTWAPVPQVAAGAPYSFETPAGCFGVASASEGVYVLQIVVEEPSQGNYSGLNRYSLRVNAGSRLYGLGDFSIYNNSSGTATQFFVAEVADWYKGKTFVVELFDPGESTQTGTLQMVGPDGNVFDDGACRIYVRNSAAAAWTLQSSPTSCQESVSPNEYNNRWIKFEMDLPVSYSCTSCWWRVNYSYPGTVNDTTTWRAYVVGNPVHLIPNG
jgi:hypothetical protein